MHTYDSCSPHQADWKILAVNVDEMGPLRPSKKRASEQASPPSRESGVSSPLCLGYAPTHRPAPRQGCALRGGCGPHHAGPRPGVRPCKPARPSLLRALESGFPPESSPGTGSRNPTEAHKPRSVPGRFRSLPTRPPTGAWPCAHRRLELPVQSTPTSRHRTCIHAHATHN